MYNSASVAKSILQNLTYYGTPIEQANSIKFLGLQLDKYLNWKVNVNMVCQKINRTEKSLEILFS